MKKIVARAAPVLLGVMGAAVLMVGVAGASGPARFTLQSMLHGAEQCLQVKPGGEGGYMAPCDGSDAQQWDAYPTKGGKNFALRNLHSDDLCLESGNGFDAKVPLERSVYMGQCGKYTGQEWYVEMVPNAGFRLKSNYSGPGKCLESNGRGEGAALDGTSFMDECKNVTGQIWSVGGGELVDGMPVARD